MERNLNRHRNQGGKKLRREIKGADNANGEHKTHEVETQM